METCVTIYKNPVVILLADDDEDDRLLTADALRASAVSSDLKTVNDGEELMDYLYRRGKHALPASSPRPDLVLLDLNMPKRNGREALCEMKADPALRSIPVVILTTSQRPDHIKSTYDLGANSLIVKPVTFRGLVQAMTVLTEYWFHVAELPNGTER
jgi:CheY-like chemotaxis protein